MDNIRHMVVRLDAGEKYGMGHLSRCISLAEEFIPEFQINFIIKTDNTLKVTTFIEEKLTFGNYHTDFIADFETNVDNELDTLIEKVNKLNAFLIVDHYNADREYQLRLRKNNIKWLQFDSHGKIKFYADFVLHASPGATQKLYKPLTEYTGTELLLGPNYAVVNKTFSKARTKAKIRQTVKHIFVCFGGGDDKGAALKTVNNIKSLTERAINITLLVPESNAQYNEILDAANFNSNINILSNSPEVHHIMANADLAVIAPGTLSYEAASVGLPMVLVTIADNQNINAEGWSKIGAGINLGNVENLEKNRLSETIEDLITSPEKLQAMSENCFNAVDGRGTERVKSKILDIIL
ncbi:MAG: UDP-2,4-diacetamido-2,4,6-trideoxy-beta-L-altropyranose hydrolase [Bacteroidota bacterium]|nr:UDP-2,4-diacetamido-2,4,6-trideoxy-beta-L-altropyranose hydrolase [Bacteroidota bacterium]